MLQHANISRETIIEMFRKRRFNSAKKWTLMTKQPDSQKGSSFFQDGRLGAKSALSDGDDGVWVVFGGGSAIEDYGDFLVHIFSEPLREYYRLERLWADAPDVTADFS